LGVVANHAGRLWFRGDTFILGRPRRVFDFEEFGRGTKSSSGERCWSAAYPSCRDQAGHAASMWARLGPRPSRQGLTMEPARRPLAGRVLGGRGKNNRGSLLGERMRAAEWKNRWPPILWAAREDSLRALGWCESWWGWRLGSCSPATRRLVNIYVPAPLQRRHRWLLGVSPGQGPWIARGFALWIVINRLRGSPGWMCGCVWESQGLNGIGATQSSPRSSQASHSAGWASVGSRVDGLPP